MSSSFVACIYIFSIMYIAIEHSGICFNFFAHIASAVRVRDMLERTRIHANIDTAWSRVPFSIHLETWSCSGWSCHFFK